MKQVIAMHGWSGDSNTWKVWAEYFQSNGWLWQSGERGYGNMSPFDPMWKKLSIRDPYQRRVVIAHSLGPHLLRSAVLNQATDVVLLGSFSRFIPDGVERRYLETALKGMQKQLGTNKEGTMLNDFIKKACQPEAINTIPPGPITNGLSIQGRKRLQADLELLINSHSLPAGLSVKSKVLIVQGEQDSIIVPSTRSFLIEDLKKHLDSMPTYWSIPDAGHLLLIPKLKSRVKNWLDAFP